jgi:hypothetical protein
MAKNEMPDWSDMIGDSIESNKSRSGGSAEYGNIFIPEELGKNAIFKVKFGERVNFDILPYRVTDPKHLDRKEEKERAVEDSLYYYKPYYVHKYVGEENKTETCLKTWGEPCPICEYVDQRKKEGAADDEINKIKAKYWTLFAVVPIDHQEYEEEIKLFNISYFKFMELLLMDLEEKEWHRNFADIKNGKTLSVRFSKKSFKGQPFAQATDIEFLERQYEYPDEILEQVPPLDDLLIRRSYEELMARVQGIPNEETEEGEQEDEPPFEDTPAESKKTTGVKRLPKEEKQQPEKKEQKPRQTKQVKSTGTTSKKTTKSQTKGETGVKSTSKKEPDSNEQEQLTCPREQDLGLMFGRDWNAHDACEECNIFQECYKHYKQNFKA